ncbi:MAG: hypothetical protein EOM83_03795 [Clostridia bacterium]|nr:hypothetical protein [Clostridia bacterium]
MENNNFKKDLDQLIRIFKRLKNRSQEDHFSHLGPAFTQNLDFIINNYEMVRNQIPQEMLAQMGAPFQQMLHQFIQQMKNELGDDFYLEEDDSETPASQPIITPPAAAKTTEIDFTAEVAAIDKQLKSPGLTEAQVDALLDRRNQLIARSSSGA